jgi:hypothetical protein
MHSGMLLRQAPTSYAVSVMAAAKSTRHMGSAVNFLQNS